MYERSETASALPVYVQISEVLIREIASGRLVQGTRLPPERELAKEHGTTVRTLRKALDLIEKKGLIERIQGSGNYVRSNQAPESVYSMFRLELLGGGGLPTAKVLSLREMDKAGDLPTFGRSERATRIRRLRYLNRTPVALEEIWLDRSAGEVARDQLSDSLYRYYKLKLGFWISRAEDYVGVAPVPDWTPAEFEPRAGEAVGFVERFGHSAQIGTVEYSRSWFDHAKARYVQRLT